MMVCVCAHGTICHSHHKIQCNIIQLAPKIISDYSRFCFVVIFLFIYLLLPLLNVVVFFCSVVHFVRDDYCKLDSFAIKYRGFFSLFRSLLVSYIYFFLFFILCYCFARFNFIPFARAQTI